jgi:Glycosyl hydrolase family 26
MTAFARSPLVRRFAAGIVLAAAALALVPAAGASGSQRAVDIGPNLVPGQGSLFGAYVGRSPGADHYAGVLALEHNLGYKLGIDEHYKSWRNTHVKEEALDVQAGRIPMLNWSPGGTTTATAISSGSQDATIRAMALAIKGLGQPVFLRLAYEMDQPQGHPRYIGTAQQFVPAWRRVYTMFRKLGVTNARFVWCPIARNFATGKAQSFYPGDAYVDWIAADGYNWYPAKKSWRAYGEIFSAYYAWASKRGKPLMVAETGAMEDRQHPGRKAAWIDDAHAWIKAHQAIKAALYFDSISPKGYDFRATTSASAFAAFRAWGADAYFNPRR